MVRIGLSRSDLATNFFWCTGKAPWSRIILSGLASLLWTVDTPARFRTGDLKVKAERDSRA